MINLRKSLSIALFFITFFVINNGISFAASSHGALRSYINNRGGYYSYQIPNMDSNWNSTARPFILKTLWVIGDNNGSWAEVGFMDGDLNGNDYHGFYTAYGYMSNNTLTQYEEFPVSGFSTNVGDWHNFEVQYIGNNYWRAYVDYQRVQDYWMQGTTSPMVQVGWETGTFVSGYTNYTYDSPNYSSYHQYKSTTSENWYNWWSGEVYDTDGGNNASITPNGRFGTTNGVTDYSKAYYYNP